MFHHSDLFLHPSLGVVSKIPTEFGEPSTDCVVEKRSISARKQRPQKRWPLTLAKNTTPSSSCNKIIMRGAGLTYCDCQTVRQSKARASWQPRCYITSCLANMPSTPLNTLVVFFRGTMAFNRKQKSVAKCAPWPHLKGRQRQQNIAILQGYNTTTPR